MSALDPADRLPGPLPAGERLLWQGRPSAGPVARHVFRLPLVALYFGLLGLAAVGVSLETGAAMPEALLGLVVPLPLAVPTLGLLAAASWASARTTTYSITDRRVILQIGVGLTKTVNIPLRRIARAEWRVQPDGSLDIALTMRGPEKIAWFALWPHARAWRFSQPQPMLRGLGGLGDGADAARVLTDALMAAAPGIRHLGPELAPEATPERPAEAPAPSGAVPTGAVPAHG